MDEIQSDVEDLQVEIVDLSYHISNAGSCEEVVDLIANLEAAAKEVDGIREEIYRQLKLARKCRRDSVL